MANRKTAKRRVQAKTAAKTAAASGSYSKANTRAMRQAGVNQYRINAIRTAAKQSTGAGRAGYGVTNTGVPGGHSMPGGTDAQGRPIPPSQASNIFKLNIPSGMVAPGTTNIMGNPFNNFDTGFQVVGDGVNWQDPAMAAELAKYTSPGAVNNHINSMWAMSSANPNRDRNMAAFIDSGHWESLVTGGAPGAFDTTGASTPWSQQYAAANGSKAGQAAGTLTDLSMKRALSAGTQASAQSGSSALLKALTITSALGSNINPLAGLRLA